MIKYISLFVLLIILTSAGCGKKKTCDDFKTGNFIYAGDEFKDVSILRTEDEQIESSDKFNYSDTYEINWTSDCDYFLVFKRTSNAERMPFSKFDTIFAKIIEITPEGYIYNARVNNNPINPTGELILTD